MKIKKNLLILGMVLTLVFLTACGAVKNKIADKVTEKAVEKAIEKSTGGKVDINKDGGKITTDKGTYEAGDDLKWPADKMGDLPEPKGKITAVMSDAATKGCSIAYSDMEFEDAKKYVEALKKQGYDNGMEAVDADGVIFGGKKADGAGVNFTYNKTGKDGVIAYTPGGGDKGGNTQAANTTPAPSQESNQEAPAGGTGNSSQPPTPTPVDMTDAAPWPKDFIKGVPELEGKIVDVETFNDTEKKVHLEYVEKADAQKFVESLKNNGYTVDKNDASSVDSIYFAARNDKEDWVEFSWEGSKIASVTMQKAEE